MSESPLRKYARGLENEFFAKRDQEKLQALREKLATEAKVAELAAATGIENEEVLKQLHDLDIGADTFAAIALVPLVEIAWADGKLDAPERDAVLKAAIAEGVDPDGPAHGLLVAWMASRPGPELRAAWFEYVRAFCKTMSPEACLSFKRTVLGNAQSIAEASGGFLGLGNRISPIEQEVVRDLQAAFGD